MSSIFIGDGVKTVEQRDQNLHNYNIEFTCSCKSVITILPATLYQCCQCQLKFWYH